MLKRLLAYVLAMALVPLPALSVPASQSAVTYQLHVENQALEQALQEFANQSGLQIIFFSGIAQGLSAPPLSGEYTLDAALTALLAGSDLTFRVVNGRTVEIRKSASRKKAGLISRKAQNGDIQRVSAGTLQSSALQEVVVHGTSEALVATRIQTPLREIPQTLSIVSREQFSQQGGVSVAEALSQGVGVTSVRLSSLEQRLYVRGYRISGFHLDGGAALSPWNSVTDSPFIITQDLSEFDHIEVLRGADALFGADSVPGATVNLVRKRAQEKPAVSMSVWAGAWQERRVEVDVTGPLAEDGRLRGRLVGAYDDRGYFYDVANHRMKRVFGAIEYDLLPQTVLTVGGSYQWDDTRPWLRGLPRYLDGSDPGLPRGTVLAFDWSRYTTRNHEVYLQIKHAFSDNWKLRFSGTSLGAAMTMGFGFLDSPINPVTQALNDNAQADYSPFPNKQEQLALDLTLTGAFEAFGHRAEVAIGTDFGRSKEDLAQQVVTAFGPVLSSVYAFDQSLFRDPRAAQTRVLVIHDEPYTRLSGAFASVRVYLTGALSAVGGARVSWGRYTWATALLQDGRTLIAERNRLGDDGKVTPYAGVTYDLNPHYTVYASYTDIYQSLGQHIGRDGKKLSPADGIVAEAGVKGVWREGALNGLLALYRIRQEGLASADPRARLPGVRGLCCFLSDASTYSKGADLELSGAIAKGWLLSAGYTYNVNHDDSGAPLSRPTPRHLVKLWTSVSLPGRLSRWMLGASIKAQSPNSNIGTYCSRLATNGSCRESAPFKVEQPAFATLDLRTGYEIDARWRAALAVTNVLDKRYYETINIPSYGNWYGEPRGFLLTLDGRF